MSSFKATTDQAVFDFLRDAQWRVAEITIELDNLDDKDTPEYKNLERVRFELYQFMDVVYFGTTAMSNDDYNFLIAGDWTDEDIVAEIEFLRAFSNMNQTPSLSFVGTVSSLRNTIINTDGVSESIPQGAPNDFLVYDANGNPATAPFPSNAGADDSDTADTYFAGR